MHHVIQPIFCSHRFKKIFIQVTASLGHAAVCGTGITVKHVSRLHLLRLSNCSPIRTSQICSQGMIRTSSLQWDEPFTKVFCSSLPASMIKNIQFSPCQSAISPFNSERKRIRWNFHGKVKMIRKNRLHAHGNTSYIHASVMEALTMEPQSAKRPTLLKQNRGSFIHSK